jgi:hypothetical protein
MRFSMLLIICLGISMAFAGCTSNSPDDEVPGLPPPSKAESIDSGPETFAFPIAIDLSAGNQSGPEPAEVNLFSPDNYGAFAVSANASAIVVEARWTCQTSTTCGFRVAAAAPVSDTQSTVVFQSYGTGYAKAISPPDLKLVEGTWLATVRSDSVSSNVQGEIRVSVFYDGAVVPDGYTAF